MKTGPDLSACRFRTVFACVVGPASTLIRLHIDSCGYLRTRSHAGGFVHQRAWLLVSPSRGACTSHINQIKGDIFDAGSSRLYTLGMGDIPTKKYQPARDHLLRK